MYSWIWVACFSLLIFFNNTLESTPYDPPTRPVWGHTPPLVPPQRHITTPKLFILNKIPL